MHAALWIGDAALPEFAPAAEVLRRRLRLTIVDDVDAALRSGGDDFDVVVSAEALPRQNSAALLERLRRRFAAIPIVRLCGPLCDGELRSAPPEPAHRYRWSEAAEQFERDCDALDCGACPSWGRPVTGGWEEARLDNESEAVVSLAEKRVAVEANDRAVAAWVADFTRAQGGIVVKLHDGAPIVDRPDVLLLQPPLDVEVAVARVAERRAALAAARIVALTAFPRRVVIERLQQAGADAVVALPAGPGVLEHAVARLNRR